MSNIRFTNSRTYEQFYNIFHIAATIICIVLTFFVILADEGKMYIPPIFFVAALICFLNAYDKVDLVKKTSRDIRKCIHLIGVGALSLIMTALSIICFWL